MTIRAVLFDVGGVLLRTEDPAPRRALEERLGLPRGGLADLVFNSPVSLAASVGKATPGQIWEHIGQRLALPPASLEEVQREFWAGDRWDQRLIDFVRALRPRRRTAVLSNAWPDARESFAPLLTSGAFEALIISAEEGLMKPDPQFFQLALDRLETRPQETILVDDMPANVQSARALGMGAVQFTNTDDVVAQLRRMLGL
jgi:HAD superfamily hydrolase (TIGR01509 family)